MKGDRRAEREEYQGPSLLGDSNSSQAGVKPSRPLKSEKEQQRISTKPTKTLAYRTLETIAAPRSYTAGAACDASVTMPSEERAFGHFKGARALVKMSAACLSVSI